MYNLITRSRIDDMETSDGCRNEIVICIGTSDFRESAIIFENLESKKVRCSKFFSQDSYVTNSHEQLENRFAIHKKNF